MIKPIYAEMVVALDAAFAEHMKTLFVTLAVGVSDPQASVRFARGFADAIKAYDLARTAIGDFK